MNIVFFKATWPTDSNFIWRISDPVNVLKLDTLFSICFQIKCWLLRLEFAKSLSDYQTGNIDFKLKKVLLPPPLGNFADISFLEENFKPHLLRDLCTLCSGALVCDSL